MKLEDVLTRPTVPQIRGFKRAKTQKNAVEIATEGDLQRLLNHIQTRVEQRETNPKIPLCREDTYLHFTHPLLPEEVFGPNGYDARNWDLKDASKEFMRKQVDPFYVIARKAKSGDEQLAKWREAGSIVNMLFDDIAHNTTPNKIRSGYAFRPTVSRNTKTRFAHWDQLCAGALIHEAIDYDSITILKYFDGDTAKVNGGKVIATVKLEDAQYKVTFENVPFSRRENQGKRAFALDYSADSMKATISGLPHGKNSNFGGHERLEFPAPVIAAWYGVIDELTQEQYSTAKQSLIIRPTQKLVDAYTLLLNHAIFTGKQNSADKKPGEFLLRQAQINYVLGSLIQRDPKAYLRK